MPNVRLPRSAESRKDLTYAILIHRVFPQRTMGDAFAGKRFRPGANIPEAALWPESDYPPQPLLLEYAGSDRSGSGHRARSNQKYILWRFDTARLEWLELARASAAAVEWVEVLKPVALRWLIETNPAQAMCAQDAAARVLGLLESELEPLRTEDRRNLLGLLYEQFTARLCRDSVADE